MLRPSRFWGNQIQKGSIFMFKRITAIALALVICAAAAFLGCQPTPDHDIIVNRGDDDNIGGASTPTKAPEGKPGEPIITPEPVVKIEVPEHLSILENTSEVRPVSFPCFQE